MMAKIKQQRGVSLGGLVMILVVFVVAAILLMKLIPAYMENGKIQKAFDAITQDSSMQDASVGDIRDAYFKRANTMNDITRVMPGDVEIIKENGRLSLSATYNVKIPFAGNVSLLLEFHPASPK